MYIIDKTFGGGVCRLVFSNGSFIAAKGSYALVLDQYQIGQRFLLKGPTLSAT